MTFKYRQFQKDIILIAIRWYLAYPLSYRNIQEMMAERGVTVDHSTLNRWVVRYSPELEANFRKLKKTVGTSWRADETYIKVKGQWYYLYRAVDKQGNTVDFKLSKNRAAKAAFDFFEKAVGQQVIPEKVNIDKSGANKAALDIIKINHSKASKLIVRQIKYLNNRVEQDHRFIKKITKPMMGFKAFHSAKATLSGIELHHMLRKAQHKLANKITLFQQFYALAA